MPRNTLEHDFPNMKWYEERDEMARDHAKTINKEMELSDALNATISALEDGDADKAHKIASAAMLKWALNK